MTEFPPLVRFDRGPTYHLAGHGSALNTMRYISDTFMPNWAKEWSPRLDTIVTHVRDGRVFLTPDYSADMRVGEGL